MFDLVAESRELARTADIDWEKLSGRAVLVTGATGLIGSGCVRLLLERNRIAQAGIRVVCLVRSAEKAREVFAGYNASDGIEFLEGSVEAAPLPDGPIDYIIHTACPTASRFFVDHPVDTADAIVLGTRRMLSIAREKQSAGFVYASSMEVYGDGNAEPGLAHLLGESDLGYLDPMAARASYPEGKRMAEQYCASFASQYGVSAMVVRLAQTFGPGVPKDDRRLFALCVRSVMAGEDIVLRTTGESTRMYLYTTDAVTALITAMLEGRAGRAYNAANPATYSSVRQMAEMVAALRPGSGTTVRCEVDPLAPFPPEHHLPLDVSKLEALGWRPCVGLADMYENLIAYLED